MLRRASAAAVAARVTALRRLEDLQSIQRPRIPTVHLPIGGSPSPRCSSRRFSSLPIHTRSRMARRIPPFRPDNYSDSDSEPEKEEEEEEVEEGGEPGEYEGVMFEWGYDTDDAEEGKEEEKMQQ